MAGKQNADQHHEQTLLALDQLSQTLDAMSVVVERLRKQVTEQAALNAGRAGEAREVEAAALPARHEDLRPQQDKRLVVEITQQEIEDGIDPIVH